MLTHTLIRGVCAPRQRLPLVKVLRRSLVQADFSSSFSSTTLNIRLALEVQRHQELFRSAPAKNREVADRQHHYIAHSPGQPKRNWYGPSRY